VTSVLSHRPPPLTLRFRGTWFHYIFCAPSAALGIIKTRNACKDSTDPVEIQQAITRIEQLKDEAFDLLVDERLAADERFRIFVTLTRDVLNQLETRRAEGL